MSQDIREFVPASCELLAFGEPTHREPSFGRIRNELFARLAGHGFRSIAMETDRVAALAVDDFVREGKGSLDAVMSEGFSHGWGDVDANRRLVAWMREYNEGRPPHERLAFHGFDAPMETLSAPSPRTYLEHARDYMGLDLDIAALAGDDRRWSRPEAVMDPALSIGATPEAEKLRTIADDMLVALYERAPKLIAATSRAQWSRAEIHLTAGLGLLRYHKRATQRLERNARISRLAAARDALMAQNLLAVRSAEERRGPTFVFAHNTHLQRNPSHMRMADMELTWFGTGAVIASLLDERYGFVAGSLGRSETIKLGEPEPDTFEGGMQSRIATWAVTPAAAIPSARRRADTTPEQGYFPLDQAVLDTADAVLHISDGAVV
ncbi:erythromycin esterase family protein [Actinomadura coerulea]|uniref:erythromycin esterase family protein n=1 Tax=Actinomadura coerulea TaxID=46159 RepID=UPI00342E78F2